MVGARKEDDEKPVADDAAELSRLAEASAKLFAEQAAAMAAMTAYGIRAASEMASMMLGALRGPTSQDGAAVPEPSADEPVENVVPLRSGATPAPAAKAQPRPAKKAPMTATPKTATSKTATSKTAAPKTSTGAPRGGAAGARPAAAKSRAAARKAAAAERDDLKKISGIGPRLETVLNERGVSRYADLAGLSKAALNKLDAELGLEGRVIRDDWVGQAKALSGGKG